MDERMKADEGKTKLKGKRAKVKGQKSK